MMSEDLIWLRASLFCQVNNWTDLFKKAILPFIETNRKTSDIKNFTIDLDYLSGANIRIALLTKKEHANTLAECMDKHFRAFFKTSQFQNTEIRFPIDGIFMPFPFNSIQYGLFNPPEYSSVDDLHFEQQLSYIILQALSDTEIDENTLITFAFYLNIVIIKVINQQSEVDVFFDNKTIGEQDEIHLSFLEIADSLAEIKSDIFNDVYSKAELPWLAKWEKLCTEKVIQCKQLSYKEIDIYNQLAIALNKKMSLLGQPANMLKYFVYQTLNLANGNTQV